MKKNPIVCEIQLSYSVKVDMRSAYQIQTSQDAANLFFDHWPKDINVIERMYVAFTNRASRLIGIKLLSQGGMSGTLMDPKILWSVALKCGAQGLLLAHNHPSGNLTPSTSDRVLTDEVKKVSELLRVELIDHIIINPYRGYYSFKDDGLII